jgi:hypothetical protein
VVIDNYFKKYNSVYFDLDVEENFIKEIQTDFVLEFYAYANDKDELKAYKNGKYEYFENMILLFF